MTRTEKAHQRVPGAFWYPNILGVLPLIALGLTLQAQTESTPTAAVVTSVKGGVDLVRFSEKDTIPLKVSQFIHEGDIIRTGPKERAGVAFTDGAEVRINENTDFEISRKKAGARERRLKMDVGQVWTRLLHGKAAIAVQTPSALAAVRGTEADIEQRALLTVKVYEGLVDLSNRYGRQSLGKDQISTVAGAAAPAPPRQMGPDEKGDWQERLKVRNMEDLLKQLQDQSSGEKRLKIQYEKDGQIKEMDLKFKKE